MMHIECEKCKDITNHLLIWKDNKEFWQCQKCGIAVIPKGD